MVKREGREKVDCDINNALRKQSPPSLWTRLGVLKDPAPQLGCECAACLRWLGALSLAVPPVTAHDCTDSSTLFFLLSRSLQAKEEEEEEEEGKVQKIAKGEERAVQSLQAPGHLEPLVVTVCRSLQSACSRNETGEEDEEEHSSLTVSSLFYLPTSGNGNQCCFVLFVPWVFWGGSSVSILRETTWGWALLLEVLVSAP